VPFDTVVTEAMVHGKPITAYEDGSVSRELGQVWQLVRERLAGD
jgi:hypothetical protein